MTILRENINVQGNLKMVVEAPEVNVTTFVLFQLPFRLHLEGEHKVKFNGMNVEVTLNKDYNAERIKRYLAGAMIGGNSEKGDLYGDKWGRFAYSNVTIKFPKRIMDERFYGRSVVQAFSAECQDIRQPRVGESRSIIKKSCRDVVNKLIDCYRLVVNDYFIKPVNSSADIPQIRVIYQINGVNIAIVVYDTVDCAFELGGIPNIPQEKEKQIDAMLLEEGLTPFDQLLMLNSQYFLFDEDYRTAIITAYNAFEIFLYQELYNRFRQNHLDEPLINHLLHRPEVSLMINSLFTLATGIKISDENQTLWKRWTQTNELRNDITHPRKIEKNVTFLEAKEAISTLLDLVSYCKEKLN